MPTRIKGAETIELPSNDEYFQLMHQYERFHTFKEQLERAKKDWEELQALADKARDLYTGLATRYGEEVVMLCHRHSEYECSIAKGGSNG